MGDVHTCCRTMEDLNLTDLFSTSYSEHEEEVDGLSLKFMSSDASSTDFDETGQILWRVSKVSS